jgi:hypothetical protein
MSRLERALVAGAITLGIVVVGSLLGDLGNNPVGTVAVGDFSH